LCEASPEIATLFDSFQRAAEQSRSAFRNAEATRAHAVLKRRENLQLSHILQLSHQQLSQERARADALAQQLSQERARADALAQQLSQERARADALAQQIALLESSNTYRAAVALRRVGSRLPPRLRILLRRLAKAAWWTMRGQLLAGLRARREFLRRTADAGGAHSAADAPVPSLLRPADPSAPPGGSDAT
jgi:hypothetical protein